MSPSVILFSSCPPSFPSSRFFPISQLFPSGGQSIETSASASVFFIEYSGLISFRMDWFDRSPCSPRDSQVSSPTSQLKGINSLALSLLNGPTLTSIHDYWKNHSFDYMDLCQLSLLFNMLFRFVITFLPRSKCLLISWLQSPSAVILELKNK